MLRPRDSVGTSELQEILLVDDTRADIVLAEQAMKESGVLVTLTVARSGKDAVRVLRRRIDQGRHAKSSLVLLDLNMPDWDGEATLLQIRRDAFICLTPVVMLTSSDDAGDIERAYGAGANGYVTKPLEFETLVEFFQSLDRFWARFIRQPIVPPKKLPRWI